MNNNSLTLAQNELQEIFNQDETELKDIAAKILQVNPEALDAFEKAYHLSIIDDNQKSVKDIAFASKTEPTELINKIVKELLAQTDYMEYNGEKLIVSSFRNRIDEEILKNPVTVNDIMSLPEEERPQLSGNLVKKDFDKLTYPILLQLYHKYLTTDDSDDEGKRIKQLAYHMFRQGLDLLDIDVIVWEMLGLNKASMSYWLPKLLRVKNITKFFKIPKTRIVRVPMSIMQMTRIEYGTLTKATLKIIDDWAFEAFNLDINGDYFIKTGVHSSKFDFRNARVTTEKEVKELGEYLLYIQYHATTMAGHLHVPIIYGVSTTNEWVVREFIPDKENNPTIYQGLPLHTEYRIFIDFDDDVIIGTSPYWEPNLMLQRFGHEEDSNSPHMKHDYVIFKSYEDILTKRYNDNIEKIKEELNKVIPDIDLTGQWSLDIMQNGNDFWIIDMAPADNSALKECITEYELKPTEENWMPALSKRDLQIAAYELHEMDEKLNSLKSEEQCQITK